MGGGKAKPGDEGEVIDEEAKLRLTVAPTRRPVEPKGEEQDIGGREECSLGKIGTREKAEDQGALEKGGAPCEQYRSREACRGDVTGCTTHIHELEGRGHDEDARENQAADEDDDHLPNGLSCCRSHFCLSNLAFPLSGSSRSTSQGRSSG